MAVSLNLAISHGEKGGVGKSTVSLLLAEKWSGESHSILAIECDFSNPDFGRKAKRLPGTRMIQVNLSQTKGWAELSEALEVAEETHAIVNLPAQMIEHWRKNIGLFSESLRDCGKSVTTTIFWTVNRQRDSITLFNLTRDICALHKSCKEFSWVLVKNLRDGESDEFVIMETETIVKEMVLQKRVICIPKLYDIVADKIANSDTTFGEVASNVAEQKFSTIQRSAARNFILEATAAFNTVI